jgi:hypothetical protein
MRVRPAGHRPNSQLASEAAIVSRMRMTIAVTMSNRFLQLQRACASESLPSNPLRAKKGFFNGARVLHNSRNDFA